MASSEADIFIGKVDLSTVNKCVANERDQSYTRPSEDKDFNGQFWFWAKQLVRFSDEKSVIFAAYENSSLCRLQLIDVVKALKDMDYFEEVVSINQLPHPFFVKVSFKALSMVEIFTDTVTHIGDKPIKFIDTRDMPQLCIIAINNLPPDLIEQFILPQLKVYGEKVKLMQQFIPRNDGGRVQIGQTRITFKLNDGYDINSIPHFIRVFGFKIFLNIRGRHRVCFRCSSMDHLVSACPLKYCGVCRGLRPVFHDCCISYAAVVSSSDASHQVAEMHDEMLVHFDSGEQSPLPVGELSSDSLGVPSSVEVGALGGQVGGVNMDIVDDPPVSISTLETRGRSALPKRMRTRSLSGFSSRKPFGDVYVKTGVPEIGKGKVAKKRKKKDKDNGSPVILASGKGKKKSGTSESIGDLVAVENIIGKEKPEVVLAEEGVAGGKGVTNARQSSENVDSFSVCAVGAPKSKIEVELDKNAMENGI